jgi:hypothetical protein
LVSTKNSLEKAKMKKAEIQHSDSDEVEDSDASEE